jgi:hypothetical protein
MRAKYLVISRSDLDSWLHDARACQIVPDEYETGVWMVGGIRPEYLPATARRVMVAMIRAVIDELADAYAKSGALGAWPYLCFLRGVAVGAWLATHLERNTEVPNA